jgi:nitrogen regulatory protein PII
MPMMIRCVMGAENLPAFVQGMMNLAAGMTVWETREHSPQTSQTVSYRGISYEVGGLTVTVDIVSDESWMNDIIRRIHEAWVKEEFRVRHLFVFPVEASYHIRNGFMDI